MVRHTRQSKQGRDIQSRPNNDYKTRKRKMIENDDKCNSNPSSKISKDAMTVSNRYSEEMVSETHRQLKSSKIYENTASNYSSSESNSLSDSTVVKKIVVDKEESSNTSEKEDLATAKDNNLVSNVCTKIKRRSGANTCMVLSCLSPRQPGIIYHGFPKSHFPELQKQWLVASGRSENTVILRHMRICR